MTPRDDRKLNQISTRIAFLITGIGFSSLAPLIPSIKGRLALNDSALGLLLLCVGFGSIVTMPFAGGLTARFGCRAIIVISALALCMSLPLIPLASNQLTL
ncbi:MAG: MFS transporter, partial [Armatimonadota bacterium]